MGTWSPTLDTGIGYVRFEHPAPDGADWLDKALQLHDLDGTAHRASLDTLPFIDKDKQLPRAPLT